MTSVPFNSPVQTSTPSIYVHPPDEHHLQPWLLCGGGEINSSKPANSDLIELALNVVKSRGTTLGDIVLPRRKINTQASSSGSESFLTDLDRQDGTTDSRSDADWNYDSDDDALNTSDDVVEVFKVRKGEGRESDAPERPAKALKSFKSLASVFRSFGRSSTKETPPRPSATEVLASAASEPVQLSRSPSYRSTSHLAELNHSQVNGIGSPSSTHATFHPVPEPIPRSTPVKLTRRSSLTLSQIFRGGKGTKGQSTPNLLASEPAPDTKEEPSSMTTSPSSNSLYDVGRDLPVYKSGEKPTFSTLTLADASMLVHTDTNPRGGVSFSTATLLEDTSLGDEANTSSSTTYSFIDNGFDSPADSPIQGRPASPFSIAEAGFPLPISRAPSPTRAPSPSPSTLTQKARPKSRFDLNKLFSFGSSSTKEAKGDTSKPLSPTTAPSLSSRSSSSFVDSTTPTPCLTRDPSLSSSIGSPESPNDDMFSSDPFADKRSSFSGDSVKSVPCSATVLDFRKSSSSWRTTDSRGTLNETPAAAVSKPAASSREEEDDADESMEMRLDSLHFESIAFDPETFEARL